MSDDTSTSFLKALASHLASNAAFVGLVAQNVAKHLSGGRQAAVAAPAAPSGKKRGRPAKVAAPAAKPAAKGGGGGKGGGSNTDRVLDAIRGGATTKAEIRSKAKVSDAGYSYALKTLREQGRVRIVGTRRAAKILAV